MNKFVEGQRVVIKHSIRGIKAGTVATLVSIIGNRGILQYDYDFENNKEKFMGFPLKYLREATLEEVKSVDNYLKIVSSNFKPGTRYKANEGVSLTGDYDISEDTPQILIIKDIDPQLNSKDDVALVDILIGFEKRENVEILAQTILKECTKIEEQNEEKQINNENSEVNQLDKEQSQQYMSGTRVMLKKDIKTQNNCYKAGTIVIVDNIINSQYLQLVVNDNNKMIPLFATIEDVHPVTIEDISNYHNVTSLIDPMFLNGNVFVAKETIKKSAEFSHFINVNDTVEIYDINYIGTNIMQDVFVVNHNGNLINMSYYHLTTFFEHISSKNNNYLTNEIEQKTQNNSLNDDEIEVILLKLKIDGFEFEIYKNNVRLTKEIKTGDIDNYIRSLEKLKEILSKIM